MILRWTDIDGWAQERDVSPGSTVIGRSSSCDVVIRHGKVSRRHARIETVGGELTVRDLGSRNGTRVNGANVREAVLHPGDTVGIGPITFRLVETAAQTLPATAPAPVAVPTPAAAPQTIGPPPGQPPAPSPAAVPFSSPALSANLAGAETVYREAVARGDTASGNSLGLVRQHMGDQAGAEAAYRQAVAAGHTAAAYNLSSLLLQQGDQAGARQALQQASELAARPRPVQAPKAPLPAAGYVPPPPYLPTYLTPATPEHIAEAGRRKHRSKLWVAMGTMLALSLGAFALVAFALRPPAPCTHNCYVPPPSSPPLAYPSTYHSGQYGFTLAYDSKCCKPYRTTSGSIAWQLSSGQGYIVPVVQGTFTRTLSPDHLVQAEQSSHFSGFSFLYQIPNAELGYVPGVGAVYSGQWTPISGQYQPARVAIVAATHNGIGIILACEGSQISETGALHPDPSSLAGDSWCDQTLNTITWKGEKPL